MLNTNMAFITSLSQFISSGISYRSDPKPSPYILSTSPPDSSMELYVLKHKLQVCSIPKDAIKDFCHSITKIALLPDSRPNFFSITETNNEYTIIVTEEDFKEFPEHHPSLQTSGQIWRVLTVSVGAMGACNELVGVSKIAKSVIGPLAEYEVSVLCMSTYQSDFVLVQESNLDDTIRCLGTYFKIFNEDHKRVNDTRIFSSSPSSPLPKEKTRPLIHPLKSPIDHYHITGLDASKLSGVIQVLLELIFFSGNKLNNTKTDFFHFSIVCGDISFALDNDAMNKFPNNVLYTRKNEDIWRMISIGDSPLGFEECGIVAQVVEPLATSQISTYYVSTYSIEYCMVLEKDFDRVMEILDSLKLSNLNSEINKDCKDESTIIESEQNEKSIDIRPGENMSLCEALDKTLNPLEYSNSLDNMDQHHIYNVLSPLSEDDSSCGTSPMSDTDLIQNNGTTEPIPIPPSESLQKAFSKLKC